MLLTPEISSGKLDAVGVCDNREFYCHLCRPMPRSSACLARGRRSSTYIAKADTASDGGGVFRSTTSVHYSW
eukprot:8722-Eustigmatos_ZCMA.PRE.1